MRWRWSACRCGACCAGCRTSATRATACLRGYFHGADDDTADELQHARLLSVTLPQEGASLGQTLGEQALPKAGVSVVSVRRASSAVLQPEDGLRLAAGDTLVLSGLPEPLALAEEKLLRSG